MKKWHMEGIIKGTNNRNRKLVVVDGNQMYLASGGYQFEGKNKLKIIENIKLFINRLLFRKY